MLHNPAYACCFSGHRRLPAGQLPHLRRQLRQAILDQFAQGRHNFCAGGAMGFDLLAAGEVLALRDGGYPLLRLVLLLPYPGQADRWPAEQRQLYEEQRRRADEVVFTATRYTEGCMLQRDRQLVDNSSFCICYLTRDTGGTAYTVGYARRQGVPVLNLAPGSQASLFA